MAPRHNHRNAFANDPRFLDRLAKQGHTVGAAPAAVLDEKSHPVGSQVEVARTKKSASSNRLDRVRVANQESRHDRLLYDQSSNALTAIFPGAMLLSLNIMLRMHDAQGTGLKKTWQKRIEALMLENRHVFDQWRFSATYPIVIEEVYITGESRLLDNEAVCAACKPIIDAFVSYGFIPDDSPKYVAHPIPFTERGQFPGLLIRFRPSPRAWGLIEDNTISQARTMAP